MTLQKVKRFIQRAKIYKYFYVHLKKNHIVSGHSHSFTSCLACLPWLNDTQLDPHVLNGHGSMTPRPNVCTRDPTLVDIWRPSYRNLKYKSSLRRRPITGGSEKATRVSRRTHGRIGVIKLHVSANHMWHGSCVMYLGLSAIHSWNWNIRSLFTQALNPVHTSLLSSRCWPCWLYSSWLARHDTGITCSSDLMRVGPMMKIDPLNDNWSWS